MDDTVHATLRDLMVGLPEAQERATRAKAEWEQAISALAARQQAINALTLHLEAQGFLAPVGVADITFGDTGTGSTVDGPPPGWSPTRSTRRSRTDVLVIMSEDGPADREWKLSELVAAFAKRRWSLYMEKPDQAIKNMATRLVNEDQLLERVRPGVFKLKPPADGGGWKEIPN